MADTATSYDIKPDALVIAGKRVNYPSIVGAVVEKSANRQYSLRVRYVSDDDIQILGQIRKQTNLVTIPNLDKKQIEVLVDTLQTQQVNIADFANEFVVPQEIP